MNRMQLIQELEEINDAIRNARRTLEARPDSDAVMCELQDAIIVRQELMAALKEL
jgi:hypothetical protein